MTISNRPSQLSIVPPASPATAGRSTPLPASLPKSLTTEWKAAVERLTGEGKWNGQRAALLEAYFVNLTIIRDAASALRVAGTFGPDGRPNPASAIVARHSPVLAKLATSLGLVVGDVVTPEVPASAKGSAWTA